MSRFYFARVSNNRVINIIATCNYSKAASTGVLEQTEISIPRKPESKRLAEFKKKLRASKKQPGEVEELYVKPSYKEEPYPPWPNNTNPITGEVGGPRGPEPTRYGDWEYRGRCSDF